MTRWDGHRNTCVDCGALSRSQFSGMASMEIEACIVRMGPSKCR